MKIRSEEELIAAQELLVALMNTENTESGKFYLAQQDMLDWVTGSKPTPGVFGRKFEEYGPALTAKAKGRKAMKEVLGHIETAIVFCESTSSPSANAVGLIGNARGCIVEAQQNLVGMSGDTTHEINGCLIDALRRMDDGYPGSMKDAHKALVKAERLALGVIGGNPAFTAFGPADGDPT